MRELHRLAITMETLGVNQISRSQLLQIVLDKNIREALLSSGLVTEVAESVQFAHRSVQEFLAAEALLGKDLITLKRVFSFEPRFNFVRPSWLNTITLYMGMAIGKDVHDPLVRWLQDVAPEVLVKSESQYLDANTRNETFRSIFEEYRIARVDIPFDGPFSHKDLGRFASTPASISYLLDILDVDEDDWALGNAVRILRHTRLPVSMRKRCETLLLRIIEARAQNEHLIVSCLLAMAEQRFFDNGTVSRIVTLLGPSANTWIRHGLYSYLYTSPVIENHIEVFISGIQFVRSPFSYPREETRLANESWDIRYGLSQMRSPKCIRRILSYFAVNMEDFAAIFGHSDLEDLTRNLVSATVKDSNVWRETTTLFKRLANSHNEEVAAKLLRFYDMTSTRNVLIDDIVQTRDSENRWLRVLGVSIDETVVNKIAEMLTDGVITERDIWVVSMFIPKEVERDNDWFITSINKETGGKVERKPARNYEADQRQQRTREMAILFNRDIFIKDVHRLFKETDSVELSSEQLINLHVSQKYDIDRNSTLDRILRSILGDETLTYEQVSSRLMELDWILLFVHESYNYLSNNQHFDFANEHRKSIVEWCQETCKIVDFKTALTQTSSGGSTNLIAMLAWYFIRHLDVPCGEDVLLDLLSYDWLEGTDWVGIQYIVDNVDSINCDERVVTNLCTGNLTGRVLDNHLRYCAQRRLTDAIPIARSIARDSRHSTEARDIAVALLLTLDETNAEAIGLTATITDSFKWTFYAKVKDKIPVQIKNAALQALDDATHIPEHLLAASLLLSMQHRTGLEYFANEVILHNCAPQLIHKDLVFVYYVEDDGLESLLKMLKATYDKGFKDTEIETFHNSLLGNLGTLAIDHGHLEEVVQGIRGVIDEVSATNPSARFLYNYSKRIERQTLERRTRSISLESAMEIARTIVPLST